MSERNHRPKFSHEVIVGDSIKTVLDEMRSDLESLTSTTSSSLLNTAPAIGLWRLSFSLLGSAPFWTRNLTRSAWP